MPYSDADRQREADNANKRRGRRKRRAEREAAGRAGASGIPSFALSPPNALQIHVAQLHKYLLQVDDDITIGLEARVRLLIGALPSMARALETCDIAKRMADLEKLLERSNHRELP